MNNVEYLIYGFGLTGKSTAKFFDIHNISYLIYDDFLKIQSDKFLNIDNLRNIKFKYIVLSPGISVNDSEMLSSIQCNEIISDLDLFYQLLYKKNQDILIGVTGTDGKSTTTSLLHHVFDKNNINSYACGNIGKSPLDLTLSNKKSIFCIETSSYQLNISNKIALKSLYVISRLK